MVSDAANESQHAMVLWKWPKII